MNKNDSEVAFYTIKEGEKPVLSKVIKNSTIKACPKIILVPEHYNADNTCRCNETTCEVDGCKSLKQGEEIYCEAHLDMFGGYY